MTKNEATRVLQALDRFLDAREDKRNHASEATREKYQSAWDEAATDLAHALLHVGEGDVDDEDDVDDGEANEEGDVVVDEGDVDDA